MAALLGRGDPRAGKIGRWGQRMAYILSALARSANHLPGNLPQDLSVLHPLADRISAIRLRSIDALRYCPEILFKLSPSWVPTVDTLRNLFLMPTAEMLSAFQTMRGLF